MVMKHDTNSCENAEMYVLGGLSEAEKRAFEQHLISCAECAQQVTELQEIVDMLPLSSEPVDVPTGMKDRVLGNILKVADTEVKRVIETEPVIPHQTPERSNRPVLSFPDGSKKRSFGKWVNVGLAAAVILLCVYTLALRDEVSNLHNELTLAKHNEPPQGLRMNQAVSLSSAAKDIVASGLATIVIDNKGTHLLVQAEKLPQVKENEAFQVWLMKKGQDVVNAGTFFPQDGKGGLYFTLDQSLDGYDQIAITQEPDAFGQSPRGTAILTAEIQL
ncbi:anti-sigma factor [Cohnella herbarum]|uniref:Anti-sigma-W factor RsiW n=1 Tax=Cohnella herbarum TaxID=2728023 RepID=A0A7Z2VH57_9BACL|nr:anti-sigma factor [Cohnella herbarum]QJD82962.1 hypothetical protein HH215_07085 [Cohnella herbarum]